MAIPEVPFFLTSHRKRISELQFAMARLEELLLCK
jgi:hypothetical protein